MRVLASLLALMLAVIVADRAGRPHRVRREVRTERGVVLVFAGNLVGLALLVAVAATNALTDDGGVAGIARPAGVLVGGVLAWRKAPFVAAVVPTTGAALDVVVVVTR